MIIITCKYVAEIETPTTHTGYLVNGNIHISMGADTSNVEDWITEGNTPDPAYAQAELDNYQVEFTYQELVEQINNLEVIYDGHTFSGNTEAQSFIVSMLTKIEGESPQSTRNIYAIDGRTKVPMTKTSLMELITIIDIAQEAITNV